MTGKTGLLMYQALLELFKGRVVCFPLENWKICEIKVFFSHCEKKMGVKIHYEKKLIGSLAYLECKLVR